MSEYKRCPEKPFGSDFKVRIELSNGELFIKGKYKPHFYRKNGEWVCWHQSKPNCYPGHSGKGSTPYGALQDWKSWETVFQIV